MDIQMVDLKGQYHAVKSEIDAAITDIIESSAFINGPAVSKFAKELAQYTEVAHVIPCANGTDALQLAMMALDLKPGDEVIVPSFTYVATAEVIALLGLTPVFVDVNASDFLVAPAKIIESITPKTKAIVPVHLFGQCADMESIMAIAKQHDLFVIEDTAQAIGAVYTFKDGSEKKAGTIGDIGTTSFFPSKNLGCYGDGGAMFTNSDQLATKLNMIANHGQRVKYYHDIIGVNSRLDTIQAAILSVKLPKLDQYSANRNRSAAYYDKALSSFRSIVTPIRVEASTHVFHQYTLQCVGFNRDELKMHLQQRGIPSMVYYPVPLHLQKGYSQYGFREGSFPVSEILSSQVLSLPIHTEQTEEELNYIVENIKSFLLKKGLN
jgi:UDP-2-acetamido-2-deoxy-ribo-hexuluronate aminotransferase